MWCSREIRSQGCLWGKDVPCPHHYPSHRNGQEGLDSKKIWNPHIAGSFLLVKQTFTQYCQPEEAKKYMRGFHMRIMWLKINMGKRARDFCVCKCEDKKVFLLFFLYAGWPSHRSKEKTKWFGKGLKANTDGIWKHHESFQPSPETPISVPLMFQASQPRGQPRWIAKCLNAVWSGAFCNRPCKSHAITHCFL